MTLNDFYSLTEMSRVCYYSTLNIPETVPNRDSYNGILAETFSHIPYSTV